MHLQYSFFCTRGRLEIINLSADQYIPKCFEKLDAVTN